jgi:hypothetical protein
MVVGRFLFPEEDVMRRLGVHWLKLLVGTLLAASLLLIVPVTSVRAIPYSVEHEFTFDVPTGWTIKLFPADDYNEPDLKALVQTDDKLQEISVYQESLTFDLDTALAYLQNTFRAAANDPKKTDVQVLTQPRQAHVANAANGAYGAYAYTDTNGVRQVVMRLVAATDSDPILADLYELNVLPTQSYAGQHQQELQGVLDSFALFP